MRTINYYVCVSWGFVCALCVWWLMSTSYVRAETIIPGGFLSGDVVWGTSGSPYLLSENTIVPEGSSLVIEPGVEVAQLSTNDEPMLFIQGSLFVRGRNTQRVVFRGVHTIHSEQGHVELYHTDVVGSEFVRFENSYVRIGTSTIMHSTHPLDVGGGDIRVWSSRISDNVNGIFMYSTVGDGVLIRRNIIPTYIGGIGNALEPEGKISFEIHNSIIANNTSYALLNNSTSTAYVTNNWWGTPTGPIHGEGGGNSVVGTVVYDPWLVAEPTFDIGDKDSAHKDCCSSVLFLPGLEGTRIYRTGSGFLGFGDGVNKLWEPLSDSDVKKLFLDTTGSSTDPDIWSGDPIDKGLRVADIYGTFMDFLDNLSLSGTIREWIPFGYDWRKSVTNVVLGLERRSTSTESLIESVIDIASRSDTGKVTLVSHSNGGLVAKYLVKTLVDRGMSDIVDKVLFVAVPSIGTPQALAGLLHGHDQEIKYGVTFASRPTMRQLGVNMPSAYALLPSAAYFGKVFGPTVAFASTTVARVNDGSYPQHILSIDDQSRFVADRGNVRIGVPHEDVDTPIRGNDLLISAANIFHSIVDPFLWPADIARIALIGWNKETTSKLLYSSKEKCFFLRCIDDSIYSILSTVMGDGTVVAPSAAYDGVEVISMDLSAISHNERRDIGHGNILTSSTTRRVLDESLKSNQSPLCDRVSQLPGVSCGEPDYTKERSFLVVSTHSPVELHVYDEEGRHTGIIPPPPDFELEEGEELQEGFIVFHENQIFGSTFSFLGGDPPDARTYISLPDDGTRYRVEIKGFGVGDFTYSVRRERGSLIGNDMLLGHVDIGPLPVVPGMIATSNFRYPPVSLDATTTPEFASSTPGLSIDFDGDGRVDFYASATSTLSEMSSRILTIQALKKLVGRIIGSKTSRARSILRLFDVLEKRADKMSPDKLRRLLDKFSTHFEKKQIRSLTNAEREAFMKFVERLVAENR